MGSSYPSVSVSIVQPIVLPSISVHMNYSCCRLSVAMRIFYTIPMESGVKSIFGTFLALYGIDLTNLVNTCLFLQVVIETDTVSQCEWNSFWYTCFNLRVVTINSNTKKYKIQLLVIQLVDWGPRFCSAPSSHAGALWDQPHFEVLGWLKFLLWFALSHVTPTSLR
jgi:hypothetical protein